MAGDPRYGQTGRHGLTRQFLHSAGLGFRHPFTDEELELTSPLPEDLLTALARAREG